MEGGVMHGIGKTGRVMDYGADDKDSLQQSLFTKVIHIILHVLHKNDIIEIKVPASELHDLIHYDREHRYVVKEFIRMADYKGDEKRLKMINEINGIKQLIPFVKTQHIIGMQYKNLFLVGFEIIMSADTRCFIINKKCQTVLSEKIVNTTKQFVQFVMNILHELIQIQKINMAHGDIKLGNIMKCDNTYKLIDWGYSRALTYTSIQSKFLGLSPLYFVIRYGDDWKKKFLDALKDTYYKSTGGYDTPYTSMYATNVIQYYETLVKQYTPKELFQSHKYELDLTALGFVLYGILKHTTLPIKYHAFIMNLYKMKSATNALKEFKKLMNKTVKR
jgi:serine/threonine protein kinase